MGPRLCLVTLLVRMIRFRAVSFWFAAFISAPAHSEEKPQGWSTSLFNISIEQECPPGRFGEEIFCQDIMFKVTRKSDCTISLAKGGVWIRYCAGSNGTTPCENLGYKFQLGDFNYSLSDRDLTIVVYDRQKHEEILHEIAHYGELPNICPTK